MWLEIDDLIFTLLIGKPSICTVHPLCKLHYAAYTSPNGNKETETTKFLYNTHEHRYPRFKAHYRLIFFGLILLGVGPALAFPCDGAHESIGQIPTTGFWRLQASLARSQIGMSVLHIVLPAPQ